MSVEVNYTRKAVEISWDTGNPPVEPPDERPPGFPAHPIAPGGGPHPEHPISPGGEAPDHSLPGDQPKPEHPIYLPPYVDNSLPEPQPHPEHPIVIPDPPPDLIEGIPPEKLEKLMEFLLGNLPPFEGRPEPTPMHGTVEAVQVFAQGQDGDWSNTAVMPNDGFAVLTYPEDFSGESYVEVRDLAGSLIDYGTITVE